MPLVPRICLLGGAAAPDAARQMHAALHASLQGAVQHGNHAECINASPTSFCTPAACLCRRRRPRMEGAARQPPQVGQPAHRVDEHCGSAGECGTPAVLPNQGGRHCVCGCAAIDCCCGGGWRAAAERGRWLRGTPPHLQAPRVCPEWHGRSLWQLHPKPKQLCAVGVVRTENAGATALPHPPAPLVPCTLLPACREEWVELRGGGVPQAQQPAAQAVPGLRRQVRALGVCAGEPLFLRVKTAVL